MFSLLWPLVLVCMSTNLSFLAAMFASVLLTRIFGPEREEVTHNQELHGLYSLLNIVRKRNVKGSDDGALHSGLQRLWTLSIVKNSKCKKTQRSGYVICFLPQVMGGRHLLYWVQWLRLALSKGPNRVGVSLSLPSPEGGNRSSFWNVFSKKLN
jgi:hypothetical protein